MANPTRFPLTEAESADLIKLSGPARKAVPMGFGPSGAWLHLDAEHGPWAVGKLMTMRYAGKTVTGTVTTGQVGDGRTVKGNYLFVDDVHWIYPSEDLEHPLPVAPGTLALAE